MTATLKLQTEGFLQAGGFRLRKQEGSDCVIGEKAVTLHNYITWAVFLVPPGMKSEADQSRLLDRIGVVRKDLPDSTVFVLAQSTEGLGKEFRQELKAHRIQFQVPVQFFDAAYKRDGMTAGAVGQISQARLAGNTGRVKQPFTRIDGDRGDAGDDLYSHLLGTPRRSTPTVRLIVGRAGIGKSVLFGTVFADEHDSFLAAKAQQRLRARPIPFQPEHMRGLLAPRTELLVDNMLQSELAAPLTRDQFEWMLVHGFTSWFMDGLDEIYAGDPGFFLYLEDLMTRVGSRATLNIFCRDSLLSVVDAYSEFRDLAGDSLEIYRLEEWKEDSKRTFAWYQASGRPPRAGEPDGPEVARFLREMKSSEVLSRLSTLPFYCKQLWDIIANGRDLEFRDELSLLDSTIDSMIEREVGTKRLLDFSLFEKDGLSLWLQEVARSFVESGFSGVDVSETEEYALLTLRDGIPPVALKSMLAGLRAFPLFESTGTHGRLRFTHELIAEALAAKAYVRLLPRLANDVALSLARRGEDERDQLIRFIGQRLTPDAQRAVIDTLRDGGLDGAPFTVLLGMLLSAHTDPDLIKRVGLTLERLDLSGARFDGRDLSGVSFRHCDLSRAEFVNCHLEKAQFEGAHLEATLFDSCRLLGAAFGDRSRIESITDGRRTVDDPKDIAAWVSRATGLASPRTDPCPTALQLRFLFKKFVRPTGERARGRGDLPRAALLRGRRYPGAASAEDCVDESISWGFLIQQPLRDRVHRPEGDKLDEIARLVTDDSVSDGLGRMLERLCRRPNCRHRTT